MTYSGVTDDAESSRAATLDPSQSTWIRRWLLVAAPPNRAVIDDNNNNNQGEEREDTTPPRVHLYNSSRKYGGV